MAARAFDLLVMGGGSGGLGMARRAAELGMKVCSRARARACVCVCVCVHACGREVHIHSRERRWWQNHTDARGSI